MENNSTLSPLECREVTVVSTLSLLVQGDCEGCRTIFLESFTDHLGLGV